LTIGPHLIDAVTFTSVRLLAGALAVPLTLTASARSPDLPSLAPRWAGPLALHITTHGSMLAVLSGAVASGVGNTLWYRALPALSRFRAALVQLSVPAVAAVAAWPVLGEPIAARLMWSATLILRGVLLACSVRRS
jgi:drug/metabolite transporter (DMT)-like permease